MEFYKASDLTLKFPLKLKKHKNFLLRLKKIKSLYGIGTGGWTISLTLLTSGEGNIETSGADAVVTVMTS